MYLIVRCGYDIFGSDADEPGLLDTGAQPTWMSAELAPLAGIELANSLTEEFYVGGVKTDAEEFSWDAPVWFCDPWPHPFGLAGLEGFLHQPLAQAAAIESGSMLMAGAIGAGNLAAMASPSVLAMVAQPGMTAVATNLRGTVVLVAVIVIATLLYVGIFHFGAHPRRIVYLGTYLVVLAGAIAIIAWHRARAGWGE
jgi:hypothetical protein